MSTIVDAFDGFVVDLDGVVHLGWEPLPGAIETLRELNRRGKGVVYLTNDPRYAREAIAERLRGFGLNVGSDAVVTSAWAAAVTVGAGGAAVYVIGSPDLHLEVTRADGVVLGADQASSAERILVGGHSDFSYAELRAACRAGAHGAELYATNRDATFPMPDGPWPATGSILAAVETAVGATATCVGKPEPGIFDVATTLLGSPTARIAAVGDRLDTDIVGAHRAGLTGVLVGDPPLGEAAIQPEHIVPALSGIMTAPVDV